MSRLDLGYAFFVFALCIAFVPVWFFFGLSETVVPLSAVVLDSALRILGVLPTVRFRLGVFLYCLFYGFVFFNLAIVFSLLTSRLSRGAMLAWRCALCGIVVAASFLPVITYSGLFRQGGHYSFWTAVPRYLEKQMMQGAKGE